MNKEQLELLLEYIDLRAKRALHLPPGIDMHHTDKEKKIRKSLKKTLKK